MDVAGFRPDFVRFGRILPDLAQICPDLGRFGPDIAGFVRIWPELARFGLTERRYRVPRSALTSDSPRVPPRGI